MDAIIKRAEPNPTFRGAVLVSVKCPNGCREYHHHGVPSGPADPGGDYGHRTPHCRRRPGAPQREDYRLIDPDARVAAVLAAPQEDPK